MPATSLMTVDEFIKRHLAELLRGRTTLHAYFTTYREVRGHRPGEVNTGKPGLKIRVSEGGNTGWGATLLLWGFMDPEPMRSETREQLEDAIAGSGIPTTDGDFLVVVYAGFTAFDETMEFLKGVRERCPSATIVTVICDCDLRNKSAALQPYLDGGTINFATYGRGCGGRDEMAAILNAVVEQWAPGSAN